MLYHFFPEGHHPDLPTLTNYRKITIKDGQWKLDAKIQALHHYISQYPERTEPSKVHILQQLKLTLALSCQSKRNEY